MRGSPTPCQSQLSHGATSHTLTSSHIQHHASHSTSLLSKGKQSKKLKEPLVLLLRHIYTLILFSLLGQQLLPVTCPREASGWDRSRSPFRGVEEAQEPAQRQYNSRDRSLPRGAGTLLEVQEPFGGGRGALLQDATPGKAAMLPSKPFMPPTLMFSLMSRTDTAQRIAV